uniref:Uncharacterized protein n=1 Tax=Avena sativa TaxID=4498 RepID=A0ACD5UW29_AVESA
MADDPIFRQHNKEQPDYANCEDKFTVAIEHNGFFTGLHDEPLDYSYGTIDFFDNCKCDTWSLLWIEDFLNQLGIVVDERLSVYWVLPDKGIKDGLVYMESEVDVVSRIVASKKTKILNLIVDHGNFVKGPRPDVILNPRPVQPHVVNDVAETEDEDMEVPNMPVMEEEGGTSGEEEEQHEEDETDSEFYDSDFDALDGDDDIYEAHVDKDVNDHNEPNGYMKKKMMLGLIMKI